MPQTEVTIYREKDGTVPLFVWLDGLERKARTKCIAAIRLLSETGRDLRRPQADFLRDGIYELRVRRQRTNYRILYGFNGKDAVLLTQGIVKEDKVPKKEIDLALARLTRARENSDRHVVQMEGLG